MGGLRAKCFHGHCSTVHVATTTCHGEDFHVEASVKDWSRSKQRYETSRDQEARCRGFQQHDTLIEHKRCIASSADLALAEQAFHLCDLDRAGTKGVTSPAV